MGQTRPQTPRILMIADARAIAPDQKEAMRAALSVSEGAQVKDSVWGQSPEMLQQLLLSICNPSENATSKTMRIRLNALTAIVNQGYSVNGLPDTTTPLHVACASQSVDLTSALLTFGANPKATDEEGKTPQQRILLDTPESKIIKNMLRSSELKMTAIEAIQTNEANAEVHSGFKEMLLARAYRSAAKKLGL